MIKRAWLNITRKLNKTIIIGVLLFVVANLTLATIAIKNATNEQVAYAKKTLGSQVTLTPDMDKFRALKQSATNPELIEKPAVTINEVNKLADSSYVKDYTYAINTSADASGFEIIATNALETFRGMGQGRENANLNFGDVQVQGINTYAYIPEVQNKTMELTTGSYFDEKTDDQVIISYDLAQANNLQVGASINLINFNNNTNIPLKIIGIYDVNNDDNSNDFSLVANSNRIYMNVETAAKFLSVEDYNDGNYQVNNVTYYLNNPNKADYFIDEANEKISDLEQRGLLLSINQDAYEKMAGPIESVGDFANTILWIVVIASILIITFIVNSQVKDRKYEIGVLMSLGEKRIKIIGQFIIELLVISTFALMLSVATSSYLAKELGTSMLDKQIAISKDVDTNEFQRPGSMHTIANVDTIDEIKVAATTNDYLLLFGIGYSIVILGMLVPTLNIAKYDPKTILTGRE